MVAATSPSLHRPASASSANSTHSPNPPPSSSNTHPVPSAFSTSPTSPPSPSPSPSPSHSPSPSPSHSHSPPHSPSPSPIHPPPPPTSSIKRRSSPSSISISSLNSVLSLNPQHPQSHRTKSSGVTRKATQFILFHKRPHSSTLTSSLVPPSLIPMTAAGISVKSSAKSSRKSPAGMKLSMLPSAMSSVPMNPSGPAATPVFTFSNHHHQAYAHSLSAQQQLQLHQKEIIHQATRAAGISQHLLSTGPRSPRLIPLGSPGPVTPLTLEDGHDGFFGSSHGFGHQQLGQQLSMVSSGQRGL